MVPQEISRTTANCAISESVSAKWFTNLFEEFSGDFRSLSPSPKNLKVSKFLFEESKISFWVCPRSVGSRDSSVELLQLKSLPRRRFLVAAIDVRVVRVASKRTSERASERAGGRARKR